jgi:rhodanese-related sulfurtransferase
MKNISAVSIISLFLASVAYAGFINLPRTGQTTCYLSSGTEMPCPGTGQDGEILAGVAWPSPRFTPNADTTITDNLTGLIWSSDANIMPARNPGWDLDGTQDDGAVTWQHALDYIAKLNTENYLGYNDWRLPNVNELESLVSAAEANTALWLNTQGFTNVQYFTEIQNRKYTFYWPSTTYANGTDSAWRVNLTDGWVCATGKSVNYYVWPVRGGQHLIQPAQVWKTGQTVSYAAGDDGDLEKGIAWPSPRFTPNADTTITDNLTGLIWGPDGNVMATRDPLWDGDGTAGDGAVTWQHALDYVAKLNTENYLGYNDWRLPSRKELHSLTDASQTKPALPSGHPFTGVVGDEYYWSSTTYAYISTNAWMVLMESGLVHAYPKSESHYVWPVRAGLHDHTDVTPGQAESIIATTPDLMIVDVRTAEEYCESGSIPGAMNLPWPDGFQERYPELPRDAKILVVCESGYRSNQAATFLDHNSYLHVYDMLGGMGAWQGETAPCCSTFSGVIAKYSLYNEGQVSWDEVIGCYQEYLSSN